MALSHAQVTESLGHEVAFAYGKSNSKSFSFFLDQFQTCKEFYDLEAFLAEDECDAVIVTTPASVTQEFLPDLMASQKFFLVEKPGLLSSKAGMNLIDNGKIFFGYNRRFYSSILQFKKYIEGHKTHLSILVSEKDASSTEDKCDIIVNNSVHYFDLVNYLLPGAKFENFRVGVNRIRVDSDIIHQGDFLGTFSILFGVPINSEINAISSGQLVVLKPIEICSVADSMIVKDPTIEIPIRIYEPVIRTLAVPSEDLKFKPGIYAQDQEFFELVLGKLNHNLANFNDAITNLETAELFSRVLKGISS